MSTHTFYIVPPPIERLLFRRGLRKFLFLILPFLFCSLASAESQSFERAAAGRVLSFPLDHGMHPSFQTEWWYFTGQLFDESGKPFQDPASYGFQLTFFRRAAEVSATQASASQAARKLTGAGGPVPGAAAQLYLAHAALSVLNDSPLKGSVPDGRFTYSKRLSSGPLGLAGASPAGLRVWNREWKAEMMGDAIVLEFSVPAETAEGKAGSGEVEVRLVARITEDPVLQGDKGYSPKGSCQGCASFYYSYPRLELTGHIKRGESYQRVHGIGWMDHEFMSNALSPNQVGWDWFSFNTKDGSSVMLFQLRDKQGQPDFASGTIVNRSPGKERQVHVLGKDDFTIQVLDTWKSPKTQGQYPSRWRIRVPSAGFDTEVVVRLSNQELVFDGPISGGTVSDGTVSDGTVSEGQGKRGVAYWEGAVSNLDNSVLGYVEMTGYAGSMGDLL